MLPSVVTLIEPWPTCQARGGKGAGGPELDHNARPLNETVRHVTPWSTPTAGLHSDGEDPASFQARRLRLMAKGINGNGAGTPLQQQGQLCDQAPGPTPSPSSAATGKSASSPALRLNWRFSLWLMGFPSAWLTGGHWLPQSRAGSRVSAPSATGSCRSRPTCRPGHCLR